MPPSPEWRLSQRVTVDMGRLFFGLTFRLRAEGLHHLPAEGGCLLVCNHPTLLDPVLITLVLPREAGHVAEKTPWKYPAVAHFLDLFNVIPVDLKANAAITVKRAVDSLALGRLLCIFAEGKLSDAGQMRRFQPGAARIALEARCPVIPVAVCGTYVAWPRGQATPRFRPVTVRVGARSTSAAPTRAGAVPGLCGP